MLVYNVANDTGITAAVAKQMCDENYEAKCSTLKSKSGFYVDSRDYIRRGYPNCLGKKIFLFIFGENSNDKVLVIRPNSGKSLMRPFDAHNRLNELHPCRNINDAMELWEKEFIEADIPYGEKYQFSCPGRHKQTTVV